MTETRRRAAAMSGLVGVGVLIVGLLPVLFLDWARRAGSLGELSALGLLLMAALVSVIAIAAGVVIYRTGLALRSTPADQWIASFLAFAVWSVGVLTLVPGLVFLRLTDDRSLNDYGARFFLEWALIYLAVAAIAFATGRWSLRSLAQESSPLAA